MVNGFSKAYSMTGMAGGVHRRPRRYCQGHLVPPGAHHLQRHQLCSVGLPGGAGGAHRPAVETMRQEFNRRRDYLIQRLRAIPDVFCADADGAFYLMPNVSKYYGRKAEDGGSSTIRPTSVTISWTKPRWPLIPGSAFEAPTMCGSPTPTPWRTSRKGSTGSRRLWPS